MTKDDEHEPHRHSAGAELGGRTLMFVGGLHRSGTTPLAHALASHPMIAGLRETGVPMNEGQHLQSVYPAASALGGPGRFGFSPHARMTEQSDVVGSVARRRLLAAWEPFWDREKPVLVEKSPPNLLRTRFLQGLFPDAQFVIVVRHPIPVTLATSRWTNASFDSLLCHWAVCHRQFLADAPYIRSLIVVRYEDLVAAPQETLATLTKFAGLGPGIPAAQIEAGRNEEYFERWDPRMVAEDPRVASTAALFGYGLSPPWDTLPASEQVASRIRLCIGA